MSSPSVFHSSPSPAPLPSRSSWLPSQSDGPHQPMPIRLANSPDFLSGMIRRSSVPRHKSPHPGRETIKGKSSVDSTETSSGGFDAEPFASHYNASSSFTSYENPPLSSRDSPSRPSTVDHHSQANTNKSALKRSRGSLLITASDVLNFKFGRRRKSIIREPTSIFLPEVIEISAPRRDEEMEERERLRDVAAKSIGLGPVLLEDHADLENPGYGETPEVEDEPDRDQVPAMEFIPNGIKSNHPHLSVTIPSPPSSQHHRQGSISHQASSWSDSATPHSVPAFPTTPKALTGSIQTSSTLPKYYPPPSLRIFMLSKHWKSRFMVLTSAPMIPSRAAASNLSYLHLFKSSGGDETELERLAINEDSIVYVAEGESGGRKNVVKVGGVDVGAMNRGLNHEEGGRTMWFLQIKDSAESQKWIAMIKNSILSQRSMRAGLGATATSPGGSEPRGDLDVMLSMRAQGIVSSPTSTQFHLDPNHARSPTASTSPTAFLQDKYASSISSHSIRSQSTLPKQVSMGTVSTLKGLFTGANRPRSPSRATSIEPDGHEHEGGDGSTGQNRGNNLMSMLQNGSADGGHRHSLTPSVPPVSPSFGTFDVTTLKTPIDRKIINEPPMDDWALITPKADPSNDRLTRTQSLVTPSLQPPPRKRPWTYSPGRLAQSVEGEPVIYNHANGNASMIDSFGVTPLQGESIPELQTPATSAFSRNSFESNERNRAPSLQSVSTFASGENASVERPSGTPKRRSRHIALPKMLTPPSGPPPSAPQPPPSPRRSPIEVVSSLPSFSKRVSVSSAVSVSTANTSHSQGTVSSVNSRLLPCQPASRPASIHRSSIPPPQRPAPNFAPPPAPDQDVSSFKHPDSPVSTRSSFRDSAPHRSSRISLLSPKPPPSSVLPPRPDERDHRPFHRKVPSSGSSSNHSTSLFAIPGSPRPTSPSLSPPNGPPARPPSPPAPPPASLQSTLKQRLRILSSPTPAVAAESFSSHTATRTRSSTLTTPSPPSTPIGEKIMNLQNDPSFLLFYSPSTPTMPNPTGPPPIPPRSDARPPPIRSREFDRPPPPESHSSSPEMTSLSPPPRRASAQISFQPSEPLEDPPEENLPSPIIVHSLSPHGSVVSLGIVSM